MTTSPTRPGRATAVATLDDRAFTLRPVDPVEDLSMVHGWMQDPEIAPYWEMAWPAPEIGAYLRQLATDRHCAGYVGCWDGEPMSYWELYRADLDPLAEHYAARPHDAGIHVLLGPSRLRGRGLGGRLLRAVSDWQLAADPLAERVVAEPDIRNVRSVRAFQRAGFRSVTELDLPDKRALLLIRERPA